MRPAWDHVFPNPLFNVIADQIHAALVAKYIRAQAKVIIFRIFPSVPGVIAIIIAPVAIDAVDMPVDPECICLHDLRFTRKACLLRCAQKNTYP